MSLSLWSIRHLEVRDNRVHFNIHGLPKMLKPTFKNQLHCTSLLERPYVGQIILIAHMSLLTAHMLGSIHPTLPTQRHALVSTTSKVKFLGYVKKCVMFCISSSSELKELVDIET